MDIGKVMGSRRCPSIPELVWFKTIFDWYRSTFKNLGLAYIFTYVLVS